MMFRKILYLLRIGPGWEVEDNGISGKDFGPNLIRGMFFFLYCLLWKRYEYIRVEYFFEYVYYGNLDEMSTVLIEITDTKVNSFLNSVGYDSDQKWRDQCDELIAFMDNADMNDRRIDGGS